MSEAMKLNGQDLRKALGQFATGVAVATAADRDRMPVGVTINSFSSVSLEPPLVLFSLGRSLRSLPTFLDARLYGINVLHAGQAAIGQRFATRGEDKWNGTELVESGAVCPLITGALLHLRCERHAIVEGGDHIIFIAHVRDAVSNEEGSPLLFWRGAFRDLAENRAA
jgi:flavin reductase (DIM6/NTAB) family NADH-FMN oxidoreductase RutF